MNMSWQCGGLIINAPGSYSSDSKVERIKASEAGLEKELKNGKI